MWQTLASLCIFTNQMVMTQPAWLGHAFGPASKQCHVGRVMALVQLTYFAMEMYQFTVWVLSGSGKAPQYLSVSPCYAEIIGG